MRAELSRPANFRLFNGQWDQVEVVESARKDAEQHSIGELARAAGRDPLDFMLDLALAEQLDTVFNAMLLNSDEAAVGRCCATREPVSCTDAVRISPSSRRGFRPATVGTVLELGAITLQDAARAPHAHASSRIRGRGALAPGLPMIDAV